MLNDKRQLRSTVCRPGSTALSTRASGRRHGYSPRKRSPARGVYQVKLCRQHLGEALARCHVSQSGFLHRLWTMCMPAGLSASTPIASAAYSAQQLLWQLLFGRQLCMLLHGVVCFVYGLLQLFYQPNANAIQTLQLHQQSQETVLPLQRVKWLFNGHISLLPQPDKVLPQLLQTPFTCMPLQWLPLLPGVAG